MNLTWHIVKKDLRALRWPIGVWFACIIAKLGIGVLLLNASGTEGIEWFNQMDFMSKALAVGELLSFVLVAALIQEDLMVGTTAFWMTRPISGGRLLRAKLLTIGLVFLLAPLLVTLPWWLGCHYGPDEIAWAAVETLAVHAFVVLAALVWSAVTDGLGRFVMWSLVTVVVIPMLTAILSYYVRHGRPAAVPEVVSTRALVALGLVALGTLAILIHQYLTRHTWRSIGIIGGTISLVVLTLAFWPWAWNFEAGTYAFLIHRGRGDWPSTNEPAGLKFTLRSAEFSTQPGSKRAGALKLNFGVAGLSSGQGLITYTSDHTLRWPDGTAENGYAMGRSMLNNLASDEATAFAQGVGGGPRTLQDQVTYLSVLPSTTMEKIRTQTPAYTLSARMRLMKLDATTVVPTQRGPWQSDGAAAERVAAVEKSGEQLVVTFMRRNPALFVDILGGGRLGSYGDSFSRYYLVNRKNGYLDAGTTGGVTQSTRIGTVEIVWQTLSLRATSKGGGRKPLLEAMQALDDAEIADDELSEHRVVPVLLGGSQRTIRSPG